VKRYAAAVISRRLPRGLCADGDGDPHRSDGCAARLLHRTRFFRILLWHLAELAEFPAMWRKTFSIYKMIDKIAAKYGREVFETPIGSNTSAS